MDESELIPDDIPALRALRDLGCSEDTVQVARREISTPEAVERSGRRVAHAAAKRLLAQGGPASDWFRERLISNGRIAEFEHE